MKLKKALKRLEQKGTGMVLVMEEMSHNYNPEKYFNEIQTYGYLLRHTDDGIKPRPFRFMGFGEPYQYIDFLETERSATDTEEDNFDWGYFTFEEIVWKFGGLPLHFGINDVVHKSTENRLDLYGNVN